MSKTYVVLHSELEAPNESKNAKNTPGKINSIRLIMDFVYLFTVMYNT